MERKYSSATLVVMNVNAIFPVLLSQVCRLRDVLSTPRAQRIAWAVAVMIFFGGLAASFVARPSLMTGLRPDAIALLALALCPLMTVINMAATKELARAAGVTFSFSASLELSVMSTAANHLPAPGGPLLRTAAFQSAGASLKDAGLANIVLGVLWMSAAFLFAGPWTLALDFPLGVSFLGLGAGLFVISIAMSRRLPGGCRSSLRLMALSIVSAATYAAAIYVALYAFGAAWTFPQAAVIAAAGVIGAASSIAPAGLGVREATSAGLAVLIGAEPAAAFAATATVHVAMTAVMAACALAFANRRRKAATP